MIRNFLVALLAGLMMVALPACSWESSGGNTDGGDPADAQDGADDGADDQEPQYPSGPYGVDYLDTIENIRFERVICNGETGSGVPMEMADLIGSKAIMMSVHAGWCSVCKVQSRTMENDLMVPYGDQGLAVILFMYQDDHRSEDRQTLLDYSCVYKNNFGLSVYMAIDPGAEATAQFFRPDEAGTPLNMILDKDFRIRYKVEGLYPDAKIMEGTIEGLLAE